MSRQNKVNKDSYTQAGRLTPDDMARERQKQTRPERNATAERVTNRAGRASEGRAALASGPARRAREE